MLSSGPERPRSEGELDILIVGALTIDRFPDGTTAPGGSVLHSARASARAGASVGVVMAAGPEPEALEALRELRAIGQVEVADVPATLVFHHDERDGVRRLSLEGGVRLRPDPSRLRRLRPRAVLLAPVAGELDAAALATIDEAIEARVRVAALQGWLRTRLADGRIVPLAPDDVPHEVLTRLRNCDVVVGSHQDLGLSDRDPSAPAVADLRRLLPGPGMLLTWGAAGYVRAEPEDKDPVVVRRRTAIAGVPTVGAGDAFAAVLAIEFDRGASLAIAARKADAAVSRWLGRQAGASRHNLDG
jgi:sugar/nucleoside kinase (ribokinase family)